jgi:hypothetical protein
MQYNANDALQLQARIGLDGIGRMEKERMVLAMVWAIISTKANAGGEWSRCGIK